MDTSDRIEFSEQPPGSDSEWTEILQCYGRDREPLDESTEIQGGTSQQNWSVTLPPLSIDPHGQASRPLVHHGDSDDSISAQIGGIPFTRPDKSANSTNPQHYETSTGEYQDVVEFCAITDTSSLSHQTSPHIEPTPLAFDTSRTSLKPRLEADFDDDDNRTAVNERKRMRDFFEEHGWLCGPIPSKKTRLKRRRAIRRLGLIGEEEDGRKAVLSKYAEMAELIFQVPRSLVSVIHDEEEFAYHSDPETKAISRPTAQTGCSHVIGIENGECWVIADCTKDWRTAKNPIFRDKRYKFFAAASLRYHGKDGSEVDFGTLNIYDVNPRYTFDERERSMLLKFANMLVYQLATLQSEYIAKRSGTMYEASINFLRRSILPDTPSNKPPSGAIEEAPLPHIPRQPISAKEKDLSPPKTNAAANVASKIGPRDSRDERRLAMLSDRSVFLDSANTLKSLLKADAVVVLNMEDYHLFIRKNSNGSDPLNGEMGNDRIKSKEKILNDYLQGQPWPSDIEPVINYTGRARGAQVLGLSADESTKFRLDTPGAESVLTEYLREYFVTRHFWWDKEDDTDVLSQRIMGLMPAQAQTALGATFMGHDGKIKFCMFATWNNPPSSLVDSSLVSLPFVWILGGCLMAALAMKRIRALEQTQISYSNLQAQSFSELRTPLHQMLAITQLLRSSMTDLAETPKSTSELTSVEQIRDLLPFLDAIDTSGKTLQGIVDNILSFLDLKGKEGSSSLGDAGLMTAPSGSQTSVEIMFEDLLDEMIEENRKFRRANGQPNNIETIFEIIPPILGEQVSEDAGGDLRRALIKVVGNAYKFIDAEGLVEIYVDDVVDLLPPEGCEDIALTKAVSITIKDDGKGMHQAFVNDKLGEPWAKEDRYATGSGLSVYLAYRIIDLIGGCMEITSASGAGTTVQIDVPLPVRSIPFPEGPSAPPSPSLSTSSIECLTMHDNSINVGRKFALVGFINRDARIEKVGTALHRQYTKLGCISTDVSKAELVVAFGEVEENYREAKDLLEECETDDIVFLISDNHLADQSVIVLEKKLNKKVRRFKRPTNPSILRETLFPNHSKRLKEMFEQETDADTDADSINTPHLMSPEGDDMGKPGPDGRSPSFFRQMLAPGAGSDASSSRSSKNSSQSHTSLNLTNAIAALALGDRLAHNSSSSRQGESNGSENSTPLGNTPREEAENPFSPTEHPKSATTTTTTSSSSSAVQSPTNQYIPRQPMDKVKVLVVEDNKINRTILVKILKTNLPIEVHEAEDGDVAVEVFGNLSGPLIVLLDINMPRMDGYQACTEMRSIEKQSPERQKAQIIAVTALGSDDEKKRGLVECNMDEWHTKPCGKAAITRIVQKASQKLLEGSM
ncbi:uncharacterized protein IL334_004823 [Kwoniella shivajii]|uniref:histidine kinase n=1 Tax=Kwoniella shivajii TaxID=564305 RepID=A0ABZ1D3B0_9TREE|nr:hypothetical protein IL334_004823 [Kwoniella shivajii]